MQSLVGLEVDFSLHLRVDAANVVDVGVYGFAHLLEILVEVYFQYSTTLVKRIGMHRKSNHYIVAMRILSQGGGQHVGPQQFDQFMAILA